MSFRTRLLLAAGTVLTVVSGALAVKSLRDESDSSSLPSPAARAANETAAAVEIEQGHEPSVSHETLEDYLRRQELGDVEVQSLAATFARGGFHDDEQIIKHLETMREQGLDVRHVAETVALLEPGDLIGGLGTTAHPHGPKVCASGCAANAAPTKPLTQAEFQRLMAAFAQEPMTDDSEALAHLLYYGRQTRVFLKKEGHAPLDDERAAFLRKELARDHALVSFRLVDEHGKLWAYHPPRRVPLDIRHEFFPDAYGIQPFETSGTVKRTRLNHLWQRL